MLLARLPTSRAHWQVVDWNAEILDGDVAAAVRQLKRDPGRGVFVAGVQLSLALAELGLIDSGAIAMRDEPRR